MSIITRSSWIFLHIGKKKDEVYLAPNPEFPNAFPPQFRDTLQLLDAIESPPFRRTRGRLELGLLPRKDGTRGLDRLYTTATACLADGNETLGIRCLLALGELCREVECSELLGAIGGHQSILRLMQPNCDRPQTCDADVPTGNCDVRSDLDEGEEDEVQAAAEVVAAHVLGSGCAFPVRASFLSESSPLGRFPLQYNFVVTCTKKNSSMPPSKRDLWPVEIAKAEKSLDDGIENEVEKVTAPPGENVPISILVRPVTERQQSQFDVGFQMWPAAVILSRWLCRNPKVIAGRNVLEVGAGLGLCGLVAGHIAATVTLSDFNPAVLKALEENVALNAGWSFGTGSVRSESFGQRGIDYCDNVNDNGVAISLPGRVRVRHLDWDVLHVPEKYSSSHPKQRDPAQIPELLTCEGEQFEGGVFGDGGGKVPGDVDSLDHQKRFEVIIASDHICQV